MTFHPYVAALAAVAMAAATGAVGAGEYCVQCQGPDAVYRCAEDGGGAAGANLQFVCVSELARQGGHESCSVRRQSAATCDGPLRTVAAPSLPVAVPGQPAPSREGMPPAAGVAPLPSSADTAAQPLPPPAAVAPQGEPRTVEEAAKGLVQSSGRGLQNAGSAVAATTGKTADVVTGTAKTAGGMVVDGARSAGQAVGTAGKAVGHAAKKSWDCVVSLFSDC